MTQKHKIQLFEEKKVRTVWDAEQEKWYFSIVDVCGVLMDSDYQAARKYWKVLKGRLKKEGNETVTNCYQLKMKAPDGKMRFTDVADTEQLFRIVQSVPSKKAEPITRGWSGKTTRQYKQFKGLHRENLRDNMTNIELALNTLAEASATEISRAKNPKGFKQSAEVARLGSKIAGDARKKLEAQVGHTVISPVKAADYLPPAEDVQTLPDDGQ